MSASENPTDRALQEVEATQARVIARCDATEEAYMAVLDQPNLTEEVTQATTEELERVSAMRGTCIARFNELVLLIQDGVRQRVAAAAAAAAPAAAPAQGAARPRAVADLKPEKLDLEQPPSTLRTWKASFLTYYTSTGINTCTLGEQHGFIMNFMQPSLANRVRDNDKYREDLPLQGQVDSVMAVIEDEFLTRYPLFNRRLDYFRMRQADGEKFSDFALKLRKTGEEAELQRLNEESLHIFRYITGVTDAKLRDRFFRLPSPTLADLKAAVRAYEAGVYAAEAIAGQSEKAAVARGRPRQQQRDRGRSKSRPRVQVPASIAHLCTQCASSKHKYFDCPKDRRKLQCNFCDKWGHIEVVCFKKIREDESDMHEPSPKSKQVKQKATSRRTSPTQTPEDTSGSEDETVSQVRCRSSFDTTNRPTPTLHVRLSWRDAAFDARALPDSGCTRSIVSTRFLKQQGVTWKPTASRLFMADDKQMDCSGKVSLRVLSRGDVPFAKPVKLHALVSNDLHDDLLISWHDLQKWSVLPRDFPSVIRAVTDAEMTRDLEEIQQRFKDVLRDELETDKVLGGRPMSIKVRDDIPVRPLRVLTARPVPHHFRQAADLLVKKLIKAGIITRVEQPTEWISSGHFVLKPNGKDLRLVTDYVHLNKFIERPVHPFPCTQDILKNIPAGSTWFAKLDTLHGYYQIPLDDA